MTIELTPQQILDLDMVDNDIGAGTIRAYLLILLSTLWREKDSFSGKHPFGNSGWEHAIYNTLVKHHVVGGSYDPENDEYDCDDTAAADHIISQAIEALV
jgi:hypothetical protein